MANFRIKTDTSLIDFLTGSGYTRTKIKQLLKHRAIEVNGMEIKAQNSLLVEGDLVSIRKDSRKQMLTPPMGIKIIYEDNYLIVIDKPIGLLTIATETEKTKTAYYQLNEFLGLRDPKARERVFIVHRLDRDTSGLIVFAKNEKVKRKLQDSWERVEKHYYAVVEGTPVKRKGMIESMLTETKSLRVHSSRDLDKAKLSSTVYRVLKDVKKYALLEILLKTGRKNQIRVHLAEIGHPVAGDKKYGAKTDPLSRLGLHSYILSFKHPITGEPLRFETILPGKFKNLVSYS